MTGELSIADVKDIKAEKIENYKDIKPEKEMSLKELKEAVGNECDKATEELKEQEVEPKQNIDDNGFKFRDGDRLLPNIKFERNGYTYETDDRSRVISSEGKLKMRDPNYKRNMEEVRNIEGQEYRDGDDRGHLIGHQFGGSDRLENLVPMDAILNQGDFAKLENTLACAVKDGANVYLKVEPKYDGDLTRPSEFKVSYNIDGDKNVIVFKNESGAKA